MEAECLGGLEVEHKLELDGSLHRKLARFRAPENAIHITGRASLFVAQDVGHGFYGVDAPGDLPAEWQAGVERAVGRTVGGLGRLCSGDGHVPNDSDVEDASSARRHRTKHPFGQSVVMPRVDSAREIITRRAVPQ